jgi:hypothetical protein
MAFQNHNFLPFFFFDFLFFGQFLAIQGESHTSLICMPSRTGPASHRESWRGDFISQISTKLNFLVLPCLKAAYLVQGE